MQEVTTLTQRPKPRTKRHINWFKVLPWIVPLGLLAGWQAAVSFNWLTSSLLPAPLTVIQDGITLWQSGELPKNIAISLYRATAGFAIGGSIGFVLGLMNGLVRPIRALLDSPIQMLRNIPHLSLIPLLIILIGIGESAKISLVAIGVMFPIYINTYQGITTADPELLEMGHAYGLSKRDLFTRNHFFEFRLRLHGNECTRIYADGHRPALYFDLRIARQVVRPHCEKFRKSLPSLASRRCRGMTNPIISLRQIKKTYNDKTVLHDIHLNLYPGEFLALVGMSGGGHSSPNRRTRAADCR